MTNNRAAAAAAVKPLARSTAMAATLAFIVENARTARGDHQINKALADFDFDAQKRLGRTRMLVRAGPALGLMGTLIPLSPALTGLANGNTRTAQPRPARRVQRDRGRAADRRRRVRDLALTRPDVQPGPARPRVPRGVSDDGRRRRARRSDTQIPAPSPHDLRHPPLRSREDRAGDPLDGLVNLFDLGIVLSVAFLLAALSSLHLGGTITKHGLHAVQRQQISSSPGRRSRRCRSPAPHDRARRPGRASSTGWPTAAGLRRSAQAPRRSGPSSATVRLVHELWTSCATRSALIASGDPYLWGLAWVTIKVALISTACALVIGLPIGLAIGLGRFRGRRTLQILANVRWALPSVVVGCRRAPAGACRRARSARCGSSSRSRRVYIAQTILALPYIVALTPAAIQGLPSGLLIEQRALGAGRCSSRLLALARGADRRPGRGDRGARRRRVRGRRGGDRRRQHRRPRPDPRQRAPGAG